MYESANQTRYLDQFVWSEIIRLLENPGLIQTEIDRRREAAQKADPLVQYAYLALLLPCDPVGRNETVSELCREGQISQTPSRPPFGLLDKQAPGTRHNPELGIRPEKSHRPSAFFFTARTPNKSIIYQTPTRLAPDFSPCRRAAIELGRRNARQQNPTIGARSLGNWPRDPSGDAPAEKSPPHASPDSRRPL